MNVLIETAPATAYCASMRSILLRLMALVAVLLLPLGMAPAAAHYEHSAASMTMQHCPDQGSKSVSKSGFAECTMACSAALAAADLPAEPLPPSFPVPVTATAVQILHGLHPDIATPPPKSA